MTNLGQTVLGATGVSVPDSKGGNSRRAPRRRKYDPWNLLFIAPWFLGLVLMTAGPVLAALVLSFTDYSLLRAPDFIGLDNYERILTGDRKFLASMSVTLLYVFVSVPLTLVVALGLALVLNRDMRFLGAYRAIFYLPSLLGGSVAIAVMWRQVFGQNGLLNNVLRMLGLDATTNWLTNPGTAPWTLIILHIWQFGSPLIIFLAGLKQIPQEYYEAASLDGAGPVRSFWSVTVPLLTPVIFFNLVMQTIGAFQAFTPAYIISDGQGGPLNSTLFYTLYIYQEGFVHFRMGYASALAWLLLLMIAAATGLLFWSAKRWVHYQ